MQIADTRWLDLW